MFLVRLRWAYRRGFLLDGDEQRAPNQCSVRNHSYRYFQSKCGLSCKLAKPCIYESALARDLAVENLQICYIFAPPVKITKTRIPFSRPEFPCD
ncbi:hypothetical protein ECG_06759 [Echinococcus granulosus]|nr:hypothetical protein ECG_06759 [Echinococcus granulosus]